MRRSLVGALAMVAAGCGGSGGGGLGRPVAVFPSKADLDQVMTEQAKPVPPLKTVALRTWTIKTPVPSPNAAYPTETPFDRYFVRAAGGAKPSAPLRCAALEAARFYLEAGGLPDDGARRYFAARCGSTLPVHQFSYVNGTFPDAMTDEQIVARHGKSLDELVAAAHLNAASVTGFGVARKNGKGAFVIFTGQPVAAVDAFTPLVEGSSVTLTGHVSADSDFAYALITQADSGVAVCEGDPAVALPKFAATCPFSPSDTQARIEIGTRKPGRVLMNVELGLLVRHAEEAGLTYAPEVRGSDAEAADAAAFETALLGNLNDVRRTANAPALSLEQRQSSTNEHLAPHLYVATTEGNGELADRIGLGVLAGWDVGGVIRDGGIYWSAITSSRSPGRFLSYALESPLARSILLDPKMTRVAIGATALEQGAGALLTTYSFFQTQNHGTDEDAVFQDLIRRRRARHRSVPRRTARETALDTALVRVSKHQANTLDAMNEAMARVVSTERRGVTGWAVETTDLRQVPWTDAILDREPMEVEIGVTHYKAPGGAWGQYAVLLLLRESSAVRTAVVAPAKRF
jgi:hypothetical protein